MNTVPVRPFVSDSISASRVRARGPSPTRLLLALVVGVFAAACNTIEGAGKDVESVGESTSEASRDVRDK